MVFFLFVIFSQITGYGLDNYGIKRMLPKLVIGAIVVNSSFYICGLLIDLSNVVGSSAFNFISTAAVGGMPAGDWNDSDQGWISGIAAGALLLTVGYFALATVNFGTTIRGNYGSDYNFLAGRTRGYHHPMYRNITTSIHRDDNAKYRRSI